MLIAPLEIHVRRPAEVVVAVEHGGVGRPRVEPHVENVLLLLELLPATVGAGEARWEQISRLPLVPDVRAFLFGQRGDVVCQLGGEHGVAASHADERGNRHAPEALARDAPVRTVLDHSVDALATPRRVPGHGVDGGEGALSQVSPIEGDEPLLGGTKDQRVLAAPAIGVGMGELARLQQLAFAREKVDHLLVGVEHLDAREVLDLFGEATGRVDGAIDVQPVAHARQIVVPAVSRGRVHHAGSGVEGDVVAQDTLHVAIDPRMAEPDALELGAREATQLVTELHVLEPLRSAPGELHREQQNLVAGFEEAVLRVGVEGQRQVCGERPRRGGPDDGVDGLSRQRRDLGGERLDLLAREWKAHVDRRARVVLVVLDLGLGEGRPARDAPVDGLLRFVDEVLVEEGRELPDDRRLIPGLHGQIRMLPLAHDAETLELLALDRDEALRVAAAFAPELEGAHPGLLRSEIAIDLQLDGQAVTVPARQVGGVEADHRPAADDDVLENLVETGPQVEVPVGVGRAIVKDEALLSATGFPDLGVEA